MAANPVSHFDTAPKAVKDAQPAADLKGSPPTPCLALACSPLLTVAAQPRPAAFRFWTDETLWSQGRPAVELVEEALQAAGGSRTGGPPRRPGVSSSSSASTSGSSSPGVLGAAHCESWELLWTKSTYAIPAARCLVPGQQVSVVVGLNCLTMKKRMLLTLKRMYGTEGAARITPTSFALPEELEQWKAWLHRKGEGARARSHEEAGGQQGQEAAGKGEQCDGGVREGQQEQGRSLGVGVAIRSNWTQPTRQQQQQQQQQDRPHGSNGQGPWRMQGTPSSPSQPLQHHGVLGPGRAGAPPEAEPRAQLWMLKTGQDAGKGLRLLNAQDALQHVEDPNTWACRHKHQLQVAQLYVDRPLLLEGRKSHLRLWVVVTLHHPLTAFLHRRGLVLFSTATYDSHSQPPASHLHHTTSHMTGPNITHPAPHWSHIPAGHITNLARNSSGLVWSLQQLELRLGSPAWQRLWDKLQENTRLTLAAAQASLLEAHAWLRPPFPAYGFQLLGFDFLLDEALQPWLLEVNSAPSIMALHDDPGTADMIRGEKLAMLNDLVALVLPRLHPDPQTSQGQARTIRCRAGTGLGSQAEHAASSSEHTSSSSYSNNGTNISSDRPGLTGAVRQGLIGTDCTGDFVQLL
ncbi:tubulin-tyrosine ligase family-domain-containing protein [Haematococcus lacustris]